MKYILVMLCLFALLNACKKGSKNSGETPSTIPDKVSLVSPAENSVCLEGLVVSETVSAVNFSWLSAKNAHSYELVIKNLLTGNTINKLQETTQLTVNLDRNTPYSWYVVSKSATGSQTSDSDVRKFYTAGTGEVSYAPFPADHLLPENGKSIAASQGKVTLSWLAEDPDNDIKDYDVYMGSSASNLQIIKGNHTLNSLNDIEVTSGTTYYWKVLVRDKKDNTSTTAVFNFKVH